MANNRMCIVCTICAEQPDELEKDNPCMFWLAKRFLSGYMIYAEWKLDDKLDAWFQKHSHIDLRSQDHFLLHFQTQPPNYDIGTGILGLMRGKLGAPEGKRAANQPPPDGPKED